MHTFYQHYKLHIIFGGIYLFWIFLTILAWQFFWIDKVGLLIVMRVILSVIVHVFLSGLDIKASKKMVTDFDAVTKEIKANKLHKVYYYLLINRVYFFPIFLVIYLVYLLIKQTQVRQLDHNIFFKLINESMLLVLVIASGIGTIFWEAKDKKYQKETLSNKSTYITLGLSVLLSFLGGYIIYIQTASLGAIAVPIASIAGILIFLIGVMILDDDNDKEEIEEQD